MPKIDKNLIVGLDIGTSKVVAMIGYMTEQNLEVIGIGTQACLGLKKGMVINIDATVQALQAAIIEAESMACCQVHAVYVNISGNHIQGFNSAGVAAIHHFEVTQDDIDRVLEAAKAVLIPTEQKILHVIPQHFKIDNEMGILEPIGMSGVRLEAKIHLITGSVSAAQNIIKCVRNCGLEVEELILQQLASAEAVLTPDEKYLGVCLIDIGAGTTDVVVFINGALVHTSMIPIAGDQVTKDLAYALKIPMSQAEALKLKYGRLIHEGLNLEHLIEVPSLGDRNLRQVAIKDILQVLKPRYEEILKMVKNNLNQYHLIENLGAGLVITGGSSKIKGLSALSDQIFECTSRIGLPNILKGLDPLINGPQYSTSVGLLNIGHQNLIQKNNVYLSQAPVKKIWGSVKNWFQGNF